MHYLTFFLFLLAIVVGISGYRQDDKDKKGLAMGLLIASFGTLMIAFFAFQAL